MKKSIIAVAGLLVLAGCTANPTVVTETPEPKTLKVVETDTLYVTSTPEPVVTVTAEPQLPSWYGDVEECLSREGDYISASVTYTSYDDELDISCYTG